MIKSKPFDVRVNATARSLPLRCMCAIAVLLSVFGLVIAASLFTSSAQSVAQQPATTTAARNAALIAATDEVLKETSELRQLSVMKSVPSSAQSRGEIQQSIIKNLDEGTSRAELHASEVALKRLGMAPADFNYRDLMVRLLTEQVAGYYEPKTQQFHLADWIDIDGQRPVMAHELTHALQDQHFNLRRFEKFPKGESDAELAAHSLIEGDATLVMVLYVTNNPLRALTFLKSMGTMATATEEINKAPRAVRESLLFPYQEGLSWTRELYRRGGWNEVSHAFTALPQSTEQILHPEKYFAHEAPVKVTLPDLASLMNASEKKSEVIGQKSVPPASASASKPQSSWKRISSDVNGEFGFYLILDQFLKSPIESRRAAAGWAGDKFDIYENAKGETLYVSSSVWDTEHDAREFFDAYVKRAGVEYPNAAQRMAATGSARFETAQGEALITLVGSRVYVIETPRSVDAQTLLCAVNNRAPNCRPSVAVLFSR